VLEQGGLLLRASGVLRFTGDIAEAAVTPRERGEGEQ
jgi:hypothetical protein